MRIRDIPGRVSFRGRLLLLILAVSLLQAIAALATFHDTQSGPQRLRYEAQLDEAVGKVLTGAVSSSLDRRAIVLSAAAGDTQLRMAVAGGSRPVIDQQLSARSAVSGKVPLYLTDAKGNLVAGEKPDLPIVESRTVNFDGPGGATRVLHAPLVLDPAFLARANKYASVTLLAVDKSGLVTDKGRADPPAALHPGFQTLRISGRQNRVMLRWAGGTYLGAAVPTQVISAAQSKGRSQIWLFFVALVGLAALVARIVTSAVDGALGVFAAKTRRVADGHLDDRLAVVGEDELASASVAFNDMAAALKARIEGLVNAEARLDRQVRLFGDVLTSEDAVERKLEAVCQVATETTAAAHARFWLKHAGRFSMAACIDLNSAHPKLSEMEADALRSRETVCHLTPELSVIVVPSMCDDECVGILTICATEERLGARDRELAGRLAAQAAVAIDNARMHEALKDENRYLADTFSQYVPASVVEQLLERGEDVELGGQQREVSVLFCDIRGFTAWSEPLEPTQVVTELNELLAVLSDCVFETEGTLDKFTGDGLMAIWSAPLDQPDHAERACRTAMLMVERLRHFNRAKGVDAFRIGIGIHSGPAVVGNIGHDRRHDYTAIGDTVNLSARIEAATKDLGAALLISEETIALLSDRSASNFSEVGAIGVKGRSKQVVVHRLNELVSGQIAA